MSTFGKTTKRSSARRITKTLIENPACPPNNNAMDSGNASGSLPTTISTPNLTPTISNMDNNSSSLNPTDILAFIKELPTFDGTPNQLQDFIVNVEEVIALIQGIDQTTYTPLLLRAIRNKIVGRANDALKLCDTGLIWNDIKTNLIQHYGNKKSEAMLIHDLQNFPDNLSLGQLFFGILKIRSQLTDTLQNANQYSTDKAKLYDEICLNTFLIHLREPLKTLVKSKNPQNIKEAYEHCRIEKIFYSQKPNTSRNSNARTTPYSRPQDIRNQSNSNSYSNNRNNTYSNSPNITQPNNNNNNRNSTVNPFNSTITPRNQLHNINEQQASAELCNINNTGNFFETASENQQGT